MIRGIINSRPRSTRGAIRPYLAVLVSSSWWVVNLRPLAMSRSASVFAKLRLSSYLLFLFDIQRENPSNLSKNQCSFPLYCHGIRVSFFTPSWWIEINKSASRSLARFDRCSRLSCVFEPEVTIICVEIKPVLTSSSKTRRANFILRSYSFTPRALIWPESLSVCPTSRITMMSFLALNMQVAKASLAMHEMPIATAAKEVAIRQATAFPFLEEVCIGRTRPSAWALESHHRLSAAANRRRTDLTEISICCTVMRPALARSRHVETSCASPTSDKRKGHERRDRVNLRKIPICAPFSFC